LHGFDKGSARRIVAARRPVAQPGQKLGNLAELASAFDHHHRLASFERYSHPLERLKLEALHVELDRVGLELELVELDDPELRRLDFVLILPRRFPESLKEDGVALELPLDRARFLREGNSVDDGYVELARSRLAAQALHAIAVLRAQQPADELEFGLGFWI